MLQARPSELSDELNRSALAIELRDVGGALASCNSDGAITDCSPTARALLSRMGVSFDVLPAAMPDGFWHLISSRDVGVAVQWRSRVGEALLLGCTRYCLGAKSWLLVMSEITHKHTLLAERLHQQRLEALGRLIATTAHDLRTPLASIVFNSDVLATRLTELPADRVHEALEDISTAATRMRGTIDCLLDYVRLGPAVASDVSIREILSRTQSLLRPLLRKGAHRLLDATSPDAIHAMGNPLALEQIFVNLIINSIEASETRTGATIHVSSSLNGKLLHVLVKDDGPGIPVEHRLQVFDPFFTTKRDGTGIGLSAAREAARAAGGDLQLVASREGAAFLVILPRSVSAAEVNT